MPLNSLCFSVYKIQREKRAVGIQYVPFREVTLCWDICICGADFAEVCLCGVERWPGDTEPKKEVWHLPLMHCWHCNISLIIWRKVNRWREKHLKLWTFFFNLPNYCTAFFSQWPHTQNAHTLEMSLESCWFYSSRKLVSQLQRKMKYSSWVLSIL